MSEEVRKGFGMIEPPRGKKLYEIIMESLEKNKK